MAGQAKENLPRGSLKYLCVYKNVRIFEFSSRTVYVCICIHIYIYIYYIYIYILYIYYIYRHSHTYMSVFLLTFVDYCAEMGAPWMETPLRNPCQHHAHITHSPMKNPKVWIKVHQRPGCLEAWDLTYGSIAGFSIAAFFRQAINIDSTKKGREVLCTPKKIKNLPRIIHRIGHSSKPRIVVKPPWNAWWIWQSSHTFSADGPAKSWVGRWFIP